MHQPTRDALERNVIEFYGALAPIYDAKYNDPSIEYMRSVEKSIIDRYSRPHRLKVVDLGCGSGSLVVELAREGHRVVGVDISSDMLSLGSCKAREAGVESSATFVQADVQDLSALHDSFDLAVSMFGTLNHVIDLQDTLSGVSRKLRPGGLLIFSVANRSNRFGSHRAGRQDPVLSGSVWRKIRIRETGKAVWTRFYDRCEVETAIVNSGLRPRKVGGIFYLLKPSYRHSNQSGLPAVMRVKMSVETLLRWHWPVADKGVYLVFICSKPKV